MAKRFVIQPGEPRAIVNYHKTGKHIIQLNNLCVLNEHRYLDNPYGHEHALIQIDNNWGRGFADFEVRQQVPDCNWYKCIVS